MSHGWSYTLKNTYDEHLNQPVYSVVFNSVDSAHSRLFASCGGRRGELCFSASTTAGPFFPTDRLIHPDVGDGL